MVEPFKQEGGAIANRTKHLISSVKSKVDKQRLNDILKKGFFFSNYFSTITCKSLFHHFPLHLFNHLLLSIRHAVLWGLVH